MKAISPLIGAVLLIAFTVAVAAIVGVFLTTMTRTTVGGVERGVAGQAECAGAYIDVLQYNGTSGRLVTRNPTSNRIYIITSMNETGGSVTINAALSPGTINSTLATVASSRLTLTGFCETIGGQNISIMGSCVRGQGCWVAP
ncbi:MAG: archaellin/type IV pilin N-terminal domain-containing protein [Candidatus Aenigmarchaeota archaeon]|nr:hypothetical protein [Candidatus Aenigmarchaeota archaeon]MDW8149603.1 archaellin/type IV pilin N-terminal domain-containing protein [Candidatus Aenigmarchaeota archaeon]